MIRYVVGFYFSEDLSRVALIRKNRPQWQAGLLNGIGGHVESFDKSPGAAMVREFEEETGLRVNAWKPYATLADPAVPATSRPPTRSNHEKEAEQRTRPPAHPGP